MTGVDRAPARASSWLAVGAALLALWTVGWADLIALYAAAAGVAAVVVGVVVGRRDAVTAGAAALLVALLVAGLAGAPAGWLLLGAVAAAVAYDAGVRAVVLGAQLGRDARTGGLEAVHAVATALVGLLAAGVGVGTFRAASAGQPVTALAFLLLAAVLVASALR